MEMTDRKKKILKAIVNEYVMTAEPIGSRTLARRYDFGVSSATIRNEMADLEEADYLEQPHRSAGRIPTDKGYRFYVDALMDLKKLSEQKMSHIKEIYEKQSEIQELIQHTSQLLSQLTRYTSLVLSPQIKESVLQYLKIVPMTSRRALLVLVTDTGLVKDKILNIPSSVTRNDLERVSRILNEKLSGLSLNRIDNELLTRINNQLINQMNLNVNSFDFINNDVFQNNFSKNGKIYLGGTTYILEYPEFNDIGKIKTVLEFLEHEQSLYNILDKSVKGSEVKIMIGSENYCKEVKDCSIVLATYSLNGRPIGKVGVLGPTRMEYDKVVSSVKVIADFLSKFLTND